MAVEVDEFISDLMKGGEFWLFVVGSFEWYYVLGEIGRKFFPGCEQDTTDFGVLVPRDGRDPVFWARRSMLSAQEVSRRIGVSTAALAKVKLIRLAPFPKHPKEPTVDYYGTA